MHALDIRLALRARLERGSMDAARLDAEFGRNGVTPIELRRAADMLGIERRRVGVAERWALKGDFEREAAIAPQGLLAPLAPAAAAAPLSSPKPAAPLITYTSQEMRARIDKILGSQASRGREALALALITSSAPIPQCLSTLGAAQRDAPPPATIDTAAIYERMHGARK